MSDPGAMDSARGPDALDRAAALGFGGNVAGPEPASVLAHLPRAVGPVTPVLLRDDPDAAAAVMAPRSEAKGRYRVDGEIARGGMGSILKGHDVDLGRDVAMKVLLPEHADNPDIVRRFVEEAQIAGQLQHPGIPPIYEIGVGPDHRPFFTMKLVRGRTLSALLAERASLEADRRRFVGLFESVCQTVAYAHARGVIHRDLKPSNVMVGSFGEVLVLDWGMGKILPRGGREDDAQTSGPRPEDPPAITSVRTSTPGSQSVVGCVVGTPRYMPPEQARGETPTPRADVYALGGILCEILTGAPPHAERDAAALYGALARGDVSEAHERLDRCGADADLVAIARDALSADPAGRPRDAGELARRVTEHLASLDAKARTASLDAAEARGRAVAERRRRRLAVALVGSIACSLLVAAGVGYAAEVRRRDRAQRITEQVDRIAEEVSGLRIVAAGSGSAEAADRWREVLAVARRAEAVAASPDADGTTRDRAAGLVRGIAGEAEKAAADEDLTRRERAFRQRVETLVTEAHLDIPARIPSSREEGRHALSTGLRAALTEYFGTDLTRLPPEEAARRVRSSRIEEDVVSALFDWWSTRADHDTLEPLLAALHPDPWMARLRRAAATDGDAFAAILAERTLEETPTAALMLAIRVIEKPSPLLWGVVREAWIRSPGDRALQPRSRLHQIPGHLAYTLTASAVALAPDTPEHWLTYANFASGHDAQLALRILREAERRFPQSAMIPALLASVLCKTGDSVASRQAVARARALGHDPSIVYAVQAEIEATEGHLEAALEAAREALRLNPANWPALWNAGLALEKMGRVREAIPVYRRLTALEADRSEPWRILGGMLTSAWILDEGREASERAVTLAPDDPDALRVLGSWRICAGDPEGALEVLRRAADVVDDHFLREMPRRNEWLDAYWTLVTALEMRDEQAEMLSALERMARIAPDDAHTIRQLARRQLQAGRYEAAAAALRRLQALITGRRSTPGEDWEGLARSTPEDIRYCENLSQDLPRLADVAAGRDAPRSFREANHLAVRARFQGDDVTAARMFEAALARVPTGYEDRWVLRLTAALVSFRAGAGQDGDMYRIDTPERTRLRVVALERWREALADLDEALPGMDWDQLSYARGMTSRLIRGVGLDFLREPGALDRFPAPERAAIRAMLSSLDARVQKASDAYNRATRAKVSEGSRGGGR